MVCAEAVSARTSAVHGFSFRRVFRKGALAMLLGH